MSAALYFWLALASLVTNSDGQVLNPPYFNLAEGRKITASATCGEGVNGEPEMQMWCKLVGANTDKQDNPNINLIQGQVCDYCDPHDPKRSHPAENAIDGSESWWQSPPLSRSSKYNEVNLTIELGQEFHVAYVFIKMGNSPRPGVWVLERSIDNGKSYSPWQYFADTPSDCMRYFGTDSLQPLLKDDAVICETRFSKVVPLEGGEMVISLLNDRPNADNFSYSSALQEWTKATNIRLKFMRTKTLLGHLMSVARQDPTVTRRYFYSVKDINIGGRCVCNGHAETCDLTDPNDSYKLLCRCQHNTDGPQCELCYSGFQQKKWRRAVVGSPFVCEPCNCFSHSDECVYDAEIDDKKLSLDIHGHYEGGGVCQNCRHNTQGINCDECKRTFYRPFGKALNASDVCQPCNCDLNYSTGNCADGNGQCECRTEYLPPYCDDCSAGYYGYPKCRPCDCHRNGTVGQICEVGGGQCPCKPHYDGQNCDACAESYYGFPDCLPCDCNPRTSSSRMCDHDDGQCICQLNYGGRDCSICKAGYYNYPKCQECECDRDGVTEEICNNVNGVCSCQSNYGGERCDRCAHGHFGYPNCEECHCDPQGSVGSVCDIRGQCHCLPYYGGLKCDTCAPGYYGFPNCLPCNCSFYGTSGVSCSSDGVCTCKHNFDGPTCDSCLEGFYNYPLCEECNCNPAGVLATFLGCGSLTGGELCDCKEHVSGRTCNECKPLYWNLNIGNPLGCEECNCFLDGTIGGIAVCDKHNGQCMCKPNVASRQCSQCENGWFHLDDNDVFGCKDCDCDVGGSVNDVCDKETGQCACRPRINGRQCNEPLLTHYFPTLFQHQFEIEDGRTAAGTQVRYDYKEDVFPGFSWRGYAVFSDLQKEVLLDIYVEKPSLYQVFFHYLNFGGENIFGTITFSPETFGDIQQSSDMMFETTMKPKFMRVSGKQGLIASPFVLNPGRWTVSIRVEKPLFLDYMVLLPQSYYEATLIQESVNTPCDHNGNRGKMCQHFRYPPIPEDWDIVRGEAGFIASGDERTPTNVFDEEVVFQEQKSKKMAWLDKEQHSLHMEFRVSRPGPHLILITYHTPHGGHSTTAVVEVMTANKMEKGKTVFYDCTYSFQCRQVVINQNGELAMFDLDSNYASVVLETEEDSSIAIDNVALVPADLWNIDYIISQPLCIRKGEECVKSFYFPIPESTKVEFETGVHEEQVSTVLPYDEIESDIGLIYLHDNNPVIDLHGSVPFAGLYTFLVHYYQPENPAFDAQVIIQNGQFYEAVLPFSYCPSTSGCRTVIQSKNNVTTFQILENYVLSIKLPKGKGQSVWLDYLLTIPPDQFHTTYLHPLPQDKAGEFITECGQESFYLSADVEGFCKEATFSLTSEYNNGALPCKCDTDGSLSYECEQFGGQCLCKAHIIGRTCSQCKSGFFGFPNCKACDCPSSCHPVTGQCICPPRVTGEKCDTCLPYTYGFDRIIGCEECNCNPLGVQQRKLQCDLQTGHCRCKANVVGKTCNMCKAGYWAFPYCQLCNCDLQGSTEEICEQETSRCFCKQNVYGDSCDQCKPGTFFLEETNPLGCVKCFCFGTTDRCSSSFLPLIQIREMIGWQIFGIKMDEELTFTDIDASLVKSGDLIQAILPVVVPEDHLFYFSAPKAYLGNKLVSYGGTFSYSILIATRESTDSFIGPDLILVGNNITILHDNIEQPAENTAFEVHVNLMESNFHHISGREVTREQMMMVLVNLEFLLIRGSYFAPSQEIRLKEVEMDAAFDGYATSLPQALRVEHCQCPVGYTGSSCENCAPGHYRAKTGPYLGYCVPCQCHGHAHSCDVNTGKCQDCRHNTKGNFCELCEPGYHGDATQGTPYDCLICACPLPIESNNFAVSCEVSPSGLEISCECFPEYIGARCSACAAGFFGQPEVFGGYCQPCDCSGNIDRDHPGSCDSVTGECVLCLNNTFGSACELCSPGFFGDAVGRKDCRQCNCDICGTAYCDNTHGQCTCHHNVEGPSCNRCVANHWGFSGCNGCRPCNCQSASITEQCDFESGQCDCKPGAAGPTCDICEPGYWNYTENGCISCNCKEKFSAGVVCDSLTGQCQCLPNVIGEKCDGCPFRWVFLQKDGCLPCGPCVHASLDLANELTEMIEPVMHEMQDISTSYFANKRLQNVNKTALTLQTAIDVLILEPSALDVSDFSYDVQLLEKNRDALEKAVLKSRNHANKGNAEADETKSSAIEVDSLIQETIKTTKEIIEELQELSAGLLGSSKQNLDYLIEESERTLAELKNKSLTSLHNVSDIELHLAETLEEQVSIFKIPVLLNKGVFEGHDKRLTDLQSLIKELKDKSHRAYEVARDTQAMHLHSSNIPVKTTIDSLLEVTSQVQDILENATALLESVSTFTNIQQHSFEVLGKDVDRLQLNILDLKDHLNDTHESLEVIKQPYDKAKEHANNLTQQAVILESMLADTWETADAAVNAANAYKNIVDSIDDAFNAAQSAGTASEQADTMSDGVAERAGVSKERSADLLNEVNLHQVLELRDHLDKAKDRTLFIAQQNGKTSRELNIIAKDLEKLPLRSLSALASDTAEGSSVADITAKKAQEKIHDIFNKLPNDKNEADELTENSDDSNQAFKATNNYIDRIAAILPDTGKLIDRARMKLSHVRGVGTNVASKLALLQQKVALARNQAGRIKLGLQFYENTTLQVRNPSGIQQAATYTQMSMYFKTEERYGLLAFLGNEKGAHTQMKRVRTDDYLSLEIRGGLVVLTVDLGSGPQEIKHDTYVSDGRWHQLILDRTGKTFTLTIRTEGEEEVMLEKYVTGRFSVFNLDQHFSKFYIGGIADSVKAKIPERVQNYRFDGCIEEVEFGKIPVGLWDFVHAENNFKGCQERNELVVKEQLNGLKFSGNGYVILPRKKLNFSSETYIKLKFKTFAPDGLLFLIGQKNEDFLALEIREGKVILKFQLGDGITEIASTETYNDGQWHSLLATRAENEAILKVDNFETDVTKSSGTHKMLSTTNQIFVGGYPGTHSYESVTSMGFEGCIAAMQMNTEVIDLNKNKEALGVVSGCPVTVSYTVSFTNESNGHIAMPATISDKVAEISFKFITTEEDGLLFYSANEEKDSYISIALKNGNIIFRSQPGGEIITNSDIKYNDKEWHFVSALQTRNQMRLDIDDIDSKEVLLSKDSVPTLSTTLYFGGLPTHHTNHFGTNDYFVGCLGDATVNNKLQNFAESESHEGASLASCFLTTVEQHLVDVSATVTPSVTTPSSFGGKEEDEEEEESPEPTPIGQCALPLHPRVEKIRLKEGVRFGIAVNSRQEFAKPDSFMQTIVDDSTFALEFRSTSRNGVMFYVSGNNHVDFLGLYMHEGKVIYTFNCGTGSAVISSQKTYNDRKWHRAIFSRQGTAGKLVIDNEEEISGSSLGLASSVNVKPPFYIGGLSEEAARNAKHNLKGITSSFPGCIKSMEGQEEVFPPKKFDSYNITGCSLKVEEGTFFSADGGHIILYDKYRVGARKQIRFEVKPRSTSGILLAVHGSKDYLLLQMNEGRVSLSVDNGHGVIKTAFTPTDEYYLCDGQWHTIEVAKVNNVVMVTVDNITAEPGIGVSSVSSTDTDDPLYIGGVPDPASARGVETTEQFAGCIRSLMIDNIPQNMAQSRVFGHVRLNTCSTV